MVLKPLNSDDSEVSGSDEWGFFGPFYQGWSYFQINVYLFIFIFIFLVLHI